MNIDEDVLELVKKIAAEKNLSSGRVISKLLREGMAIKMSEKESGNFSSTYSGTDSEDR
jgi:predicted DNA-binding ribbon-helix-helix protein